MSGKRSDALGERSAKKSVQTMTLMDIIERVPPSMMQLLVAMGPAIDAVHAFLVIATWRGGYRQRVQSWLLLLGYILTCLYGYEVLRYAPQVVILAYIGYLSLRGSFSRVSGHAPSTDDGATSRKIKRAIAQLCDISDFVAAVCETLIYPLHALFHAQVHGVGTHHLVVFLLASWPIWLLVMLPPSQWLLPYYYVHTTLGHLARSAPVAAVHNYVATRAAPHAAAFAASHAPRLYDAGAKTSAALSQHVLPHACALVRALHVRQWPLALQVFPPFPIAALSVRHVLLAVGCIALTWCSPWATLLRAALWRSALVRRIVTGAVRVLSGSENVSAFWRSVAPKQLRGASTALVQDTRHAATHETVFQFEIYENQRWWIGLDWTAALLPNERPSWSDGDNNASITSTVYTPASAMPASEAQRLSTRFVEEKHVDDAGAVLDATDRLKAATDAASKGPAPDKQEAAALQSAEQELPEELASVARPASLASNATDVDPEGWQYGGNSWEKLNRVNGIGKYTRRRCWVRRAVLVITVEPAAVRSAQDEDE
ncbi:hypothetical protein CBS14141_004420 [Malassezia furfur]|nr:hypothetical protein CBS14141_004420 [Malassezia furfur]